MANPAGRPAGKSLLDDALPFPDYYKPRRLLPETQQARFNLTLRIPMAGAPRTVKFSRL